MVAVLSSFEHASFATTRLALSIRLIAFSPALSLASPLFLSFARSNSQSRPITASAVKYPNPRRRHHSSATSAMASTSFETEQNALSFAVHPVTRFAGASKSVRRPREFTCFSYDDNHEFHHDDSGIRWYYPAEVGADLSAGFKSFIKHDGSEDEHLISLLKAIKGHEEQTGQKIDAEFVTWRGMMTKIMAAPFEWRDGFEMNATLHDGCIFIEENMAYKTASQAQSQHQQRRGRIPPEVMTYWGYKFETLSTIPGPWGSTPRPIIENRPHERVNNKAQYCSVVRTGIGASSLCLGGEVDAIWDSKPTTPGAPINWVELKTSKTLRSERDHEVFNEKLMKFWIQSFLLGVPRIVVGFRSPDGILEKIEEIETGRIPQMVQGDRARWNANICVNFAAAFLDWLKETVTDEGVWRIARAPGQQEITVSRIEAQGYGDILTEEFVNWRIKLLVNQTDGPLPQEA